MLRRTVNFNAPLVIRGPNPKETSTLSSKALSARDGGGGVESASDDELPSHNQNASFRQHGIPQVVSHGPLPFQAPATVPVAAAKEVFVSEGAIDTDTAMTSEPPSDAMQGLCLDKFEARVAAGVTTEVSPLSYSTIAFHPSPKDNDVPIQLSARDSPNSSLAIVELHELCQKRGWPMPKFEFEEDDTFYFSARLSLNLPVSHIPYAQRAAARLGIDADGRLIDSAYEDNAVLVVERLGFQSKRAGKQSLCDLVLRIVAKTLEDMPERLAEEPGRPLAKNNNYVGMLVEFAGATANPQPAFFEFLLGNHFSCVINLSLKLPRTKPMILTPHSDGVHQAQELSFGSENTRYPTKKTARQASAKLAVDFLRMHALMGPDGAALIGKKKLKLFNSNLIPIGPPSRLSSDPVATQSVAETAPQPPQPAVSNFHRAAVLCAKLQLGAIEYFITPVDGKPSFYDGVARIREATAPQLSGLLGRVECVYGRKAAKDEVAKGVAALLDGELAARTFVADSHTMHPARAVQLMSWQMDFPPPLG